MNLVLVKYHHDICLLIAKETLAEKQAGVGFFFLKKQVFFLGDHEHTYTSNSNEDKESNIADGSSVREL